MIVTVFVRVAPHPNPELTAMLEWAQGVLDAQDQARAAARQAPPFAAVT